MREGELHARAELPFRHAFVLKAEQVHEIWKALADAVGPVEATASCADHMKRPFASAEALVAYPNARARQITSLEFWAQSEDGRRHAYLSLTGTSRRTTFWTEGCEPIVSRLKEQLADILDGMRPWYSRIACVDSSYIVGFFVLLMILGSYLLPGDSKGDLGSVPFWSKALGVTLGLFTLSILAGFLSGLIILRNRYFPVATFAIGQGAERYKVAE